RSPDRRRQCGQRPQADRQVDASHHGRHASEGRGLPAVQSRRAAPEFDLSADGKAQLTFALKIDETTPVPSSFPVGTVLPAIKVNLYGTDGKILTNDSTDRIRMVTGGIFGTLTVTAQNGVATFNDLVIGGKSGLDAGTTTLTLNFIYAELPLGGV